MKIKDNTECTLSYHDNKSPYKSQTRSMQVVFYLYYRQQGC